MPYDVKNYKGASIASVLEGTVNTQSPLKLVGQNYKNYGQLIAENFVHIVENFSRDIAPTNPIVGQLWYKPVDGHIYMLDQDANNKTKWKSLTTLDIRATDPVDDPSGYTPREGDFWFDSAADKGILNIRYRNDETGALTWGQLSVPVAADATLLFQNVYDDSAAGQTTTPPISHACIKFVVDNKVIGIYSTGEKEWSPLGKLLGTPLQITSGGSSVTYDVETNPDGSSLHLNFPYVRAGLTLSGPYDPDLQVGSTEGRSYNVKFPAPAAGGTIAEGFPIINKALQSIESIVITNQGSGYTSTTISAWNTSGASAFDQIPAGQGPSGTAPTLTAVLGTAGTEFEDKIVSVTVGNDTNSKAGGNGYFTPPIRPSLNGNIQVGRNSTDFADFRNLQAGFGRKIVAISIVGAGTGYTDGTIIIQAPAGEDGTTATASIITDQGNNGTITSVTMALQGDGYTYAPSTTNSGITFTGTAGSGNGDAVLLAVLGDDRLMIDANSISGDKIHGGNISGFESSAISDLTDWTRNDPGIQGLRTKSGYGSEEGLGTDTTSVHNDDKDLWTGEYTFGGQLNAWTMQITDLSGSEQKRRAGYVNVAYEREQTLGTTSGVVTANGALRVDGGAHIGKNLHVNGSVSITGSLYTGGQINNIEVNNLTIEDNLIELNKSQTDLAPANAGSAPLTGISGLFIDRGLLASAQVPFSTLLWDDSDFSLSGTTPVGGGPINKQEDFFKLGTFTGKTEPTSPDDPEDGTLGSTNTISGFKLACLDTLMYTAQAGAKCDIISDSQGHESVPTDRDVGGYIARYNGFPQDSAAAAYPNTLADADVEYDDNNTGYPGKDLILVDSDERIVRGEFHFYRDAYPTDGSDPLVNTSSTIHDGGVSSGKIGGPGGDNLYIIKDDNVNTQVDSPGTFVRGSGGPGIRYFSGGTPAIDVDATSPDITSATWTGIDINNSFLEDPAWFVPGAGDLGAGQVCALREGRSLGWNRPRIHVHDTGANYGSGAFVIPIVGLDGTISGAEVMTKGKHYSGAGPVVIVGEARDSSSSNATIGKNATITVTYTSNTVTGAGGSGGTAYRTPKPFKEVNSTKFNGILCADPSQVNSTPSPITNGAHVTDSSQKYVGLYPIMDGHNSDAFDQTIPYDGSGMTIGTHTLHFVDAFIRNLRVENLHPAEEALTILNRATHDSSTSARARVNLGAMSTHQGSAVVKIYADGGPTDATGGEGVVNITSSSQGDNQSKIYMQTLAKGDAVSLVDIEATTDGQHTAGTQESKAYLRARGSATFIGLTDFPYGQRQELITAGVAGDVESNTTADDGNEVHVQATDMVVIERFDSAGRTQNVPTGTVATMDDWLTRFEVDAKDTRLNGHVHLGDGTLIDPATTDLWDRNVYFNSFVGSHIMPDKDSDDPDAILDGAGWDLGATNAETSISDHHGGLSVTGATDKRWRTLYVRNISAGAPDETGLIDGDWSLSPGSTFQSTYTADLAERYEADAVLESGTVVAIGGDNEVTASTTENDENVFGVVSTEPAFIMNGRAGTDETHPLIAMTGRCPCKVVGKINKGDRLVSSSTTGRARKADLTNDSVFAIIGRAIEAHDSDGEGTIEIAVTRN